MIVGHTNASEIFYRQVKWGFLWNWYARQFGVNAITENYFLIWVGNDRCAAGIVLSIRMYCELIDAVSYR